MTSSVQYSQPDRATRTSGVLRKLRFPLLSLLLLLSGAGANPIDTGSNAAAAGQLNGYNEAPWIMYFDAYYIGGTSNLWEFVGYVYDEDVETCEVYLSGVVNEGPIPVDYNGYFSIVVDVESGGIVEAIAYDSLGKASQPAEVYVY